MLPSPRPGWRAYELGEPFLGVETGNSEPQHGYDFLVFFEVPNSHQYSLDPAAILLTVMGLHGPDPRLAALTHRRFPHPTRPALFL